MIYLKNFNKRNIKLITWKSFFQKNYYKFNCSFYLQRKNCFRNKKKNYNNYYKYLKKF